MKKKLKRNDLVKIIWDDHCSYSKSWVTNPQEHSLCQIESVGFVVYDTKNFLTIALSKQVDDITYGNLMTVIKSCIRKLKVIR